MSAPVQSTPVQSQTASLYVDDQVFPLAPGTDRESLIKRLAAAMADGSVVQVPVHDLLTGDYIVHLRPANASAVSVRSGKTGH
jgi:hypothetical protein